MKIGIMSDSHDNIVNLAKAISKMKENKVEVIIHCGDLSAGFIVNKLAETGLTIHSVFGNVGDRYSNTRKAALHPNYNLHGEMAELEIDNLKIAVTHMNFFADGLASTGKYDFVLHGHTHIKRDEKIGDTRIINPGELLGLKDAPPSFAILDTKTKEVEFFEL
jgi:putative phosphoesterase